jgi:predicted RNase H-like HicB family nuclease
MHEQCCAYGESEEEALENLETMESEFLEEINELYQEAWA